MTRLHSDKLRLARWLRTTTQAELSASSGVSQAKISKIENGLESGDDDIADAIESALNLAPGFLRATGTRSSLPEHFYRKRASILVREQRWIEAVVVLARQGIAALCESVSIEPSFPTPRIPCNLNTINPASDVARDVRRLLMIPEGPIRSLVDVIESTGTIIIPIYGAPSTFDAMASPAVTGSPWDLIFFNPEMPGDRIRFTLAHEFGHLIMHRGQSENCEEEADDFASEFLLPAANLRPLLRGLDLDRALQLKQIWGSSIGALVYKANALGCISSNRYRSLQVMISQRGWRKDEPGHVPAPQPGLFHEIINIHLNNLNYSIGDIGHLFGVSGREFQDQYFPQSLGLRIVK
ncbi:helix-turn-helix domain-containing protein [Lujinxingia vulgaris]|nr:XRE family transcriptional regulator [Lujinxingia vulgaris]